MLLVLLFFPIISCVDDIWSEMGRRGVLVLERRSRNVISIVVLSHPILCR